MPEHNLNNLLSNFSIGHVFTALLSLLGTAYMIMFGWIKKSLSHAHSRIDDLERDKVSHDDVKEIKQDLHKDIEEINSNIRELREVANQILFKMGSYNS